MEKEVSLWKESADCVWFIFHVVLESVLAAPHATALHPDRGCVYRDTLGGRGGGCRLTPCLLFLLRLNTGRNIAEEENVQREY